MGRAGPPRSGGSPGGSSPRGRYRAGRDGARRRRAVLGQQFGVELTQLGSRVDTQLAGDGVPGLPVHLERLGMPSRTVQGPHQQQPQALPQRMVRQQPADLGDGLVVIAAGEFGGDPQFDGAEAEFAEPFGLCLHQRGRRDVGQRPPCHRASAS